MASNRRWITLFIIFVLISLALSCQEEGKSMEGRCDYDGVKIEPIYAVYFTLQDGTEMKFCSIVCASMTFSKLKKEVKEVWVVDESSEKRINAYQAFFVESDIVTVPHVKNRIHVFDKKEDALNHLQKFRGRWMENPIH